MKFHSLCVCVFDLSWLFLCFIEVARQWRTKGKDIGVSSRSQAQGNMDMAIAIRTAVIKDEVLYIQAGGGWVADSVPNLEWKESLNKGRAIFKAAEMVQEKLEG